MKLSHQGKLPLQPKRYTTAIILIIIGVAIIDAIFVTVTSDLRSRNYLLGRVSTIAATISVDDIKAVQGNESDVKNPAYQRIKARLQQIKHENEDAQFVYLLGKRNDKVFFYANSENPDSVDYATPGLPYQNPSQRLKDEFLSYVPFNEGPDIALYGAHLSTFAPVIDNKNNTVAAVVGIDVPAEQYYWPILLIAVVPLLLAAIPVVGLVRDRKLQKKEWEISNLKSQFVSIASHELRSPISGMLWAIKSLMAPDVKNLTAEQKSLMQDMYRSTAFSLATINEILDLSIFERGKNIRLEDSKVDIVAVVQESKNTLILGAQERRLDIVMAKSWPESAYTFGDEPALRRAFMNLISNAIKYSQESSVVTIGYHYDHNEHVISISDKGIGIPKLEQSKVFEGYHRASNASEVQAHGTGLGLYVSRLIIEDHKGRIWVESELHKGTAVFVALPDYDKAAPTPPEIQQAEKAVSPESKTT